MAAALFTDAELIFLDHEIITIRQKCLDKLLHCRIKNKPNRGKPWFNLKDITIEIKIHDDSYYVSHVETSSTDITYKLLITVQSFPRYQKHKN